MFRNRILVRAKPPFPPSASPFLLLQLCLHPPPSSPDPSADQPFFVRLEALCWKLSRAWRVACLCFPSSPDVGVVVVYQRSQSESVDQVVKELVKQLPVSNVGPEEEVAPGSLVVKAVECMLRCAFLDSSWRCLGNSLFVDSDFSGDDERSYLCALDVRVQLEMDDGFIFLVSPDVVRFSRYKIADILSSKMESKFYNGQEVILESHNSVKPCYVLPSLYEGYVIGLGKVLPSKENLGQFEDLLFFKHGLALPNDYFIKIQFTFGGRANKKWLPSAFVLQGSGLAPAPQTTRVMKAVSALDSFMKIVQGWNFFGQGCPIVQVVSAFNIGSELFTWTKAAVAVNICVSRDSSSPSTSEITSASTFIPTNLLSVNDFRTPKPAGCIVGYRKLEHTASLEDISKCTSKILVNDASKHIQDDACLVSTAKLRPLLREYIASKNRIPLGDGIASSTKVGNRVGKGCPLSGSPGKTAGTRRSIKPLSYMWLRLNTLLLWKFCSGGTGTEERHMSAEAFINDNQHDGIAAGTDVANPQPTSKDSGDYEGKVKSMLQIKSMKSQEKQKFKVVLGNSSLTSTLQVHSKDGVKDDKETIAKKKMKIQSSPSDMSAKVINCHAKGQLASLTVAELKCFLTSKRAKVGGKKEDLIRQITALLD